MREVREGYMEKQEFHGQGMIYTIVFVGVFWHMKYGLHSDLISDCVHYLSLDIFKPS